jgi:hypothetical protein
MSKRDDRIVGVTIELIPVRTEENWGDRLSVGLEVVI